MPALALDSAVAPSLPTTDYFSVSTAAAAYPPAWSPDQSAKLYRVDAWGASYFGVNAAGNVAVRPYGADTLPHQEVDLMKIVSRAAAPLAEGGLGLPLPLIVRLPDVLRNRLQSLQFAFDAAVAGLGYESHYQGVYPVKCNQDRFVIDDVVDFGSPYRFGLEAGSKPELLLAMSSLVRGSPDAFLVCNGYKDAEYISLALMARKLGLNTVIVLEQEEEVDLVMEIGDKLGVRPVMGLRAKLRTKHSGHFGSTSGEKGKFGLTTAQILAVANKLRAAEMLDCLRLLHFHIGSQIPSTALLADGVGEAAQIYCELARLGAAMGVIDIGGGLGIDYDGSRSPDSEMSVGYGLDEYAAAVVRAVRDACDRRFVRHPVICSESGRALVSHHSVLVFEALSASSDTPALPSFDLRLLAESLSDEARADYCRLTSAAMRGEVDACVAHAEQLKRRCVDQFRDGAVGLEQLAAVDGICEVVAKEAGVADQVKTYHVNLSIFTSIPDFWAIGQLFPIMPIHRLDEQPTIRGVLSDLTCDSDGKIDKFIGGAASLPLHDLAAKHGGGGYYLGMFLGGAYQEALGGLHNLFGGPSVVRVARADGPHGFAVTRAAPGHSCADVLRAMHHEPELMYAALKCRAEEVEEEDGAGAGAAAAMARAFNAMPYLAPAGLGLACAVSYAGAGQDDGGEEEWAAAAAYCCA